MSRVDRGGAVPQGSEWIIVGLVVLLLFGASQIPRLARSVGAARREYSRGLTEGAASEDADGR